MADVEKKTPHYNLNAIKAVVADYGMDAFTITARRGIEQMGLSEAEAITVALGLEARQFYKSMTTHTDHTVWQDVYHAPCPNGRMAYIKVTLRADGAVVIQFKER
jgi:motility quorum-sensing regulator/GCU-specific mRNA interferase toxin